MNSGKSQKLAICFGQFGPYHHARVAALQRAAQEMVVGLPVAAMSASPNSGEIGGVDTAATARQWQVIPVQIAAATTTYEWKDGNGSQVTSKRCEGLRTLCAGTDEAARPLEVFQKARRLFKDEGVAVVFVPSYWPARFLALLLAAKSLGLRTVMMNESHAGTERATGWKKRVKRQIVRQFDAALVGGAPHKRHFASLGIPEHRLFTGYDAVDNDFFASRAGEVRAAAKKRRQTAVGGGQSEAVDFRQTYGLPERYFLSLGRMVEKKNLATLVRAYARYAQGVAVAAERSSHTPVSLVLVGSGELEAGLVAQARSLGLQVVDRREAGASRKADTLKDGKTERTGGGETAATNAESCKLTTDHSIEKDRGTVFFYGFRQVEENPVFYALAEAFILSSLHEEWGLVVNEAMACSLPVIVSRTAGCAEDLLPASGQVTSGEWQVTSEEAPGGRAAANALSSHPSTLNSLEHRSNGFVFDPTSVEALTEALTLITESGERRAEMGRRSLEVVERFSCSNFARQAMLAAEATGTT